MPGFKIAVEEYGLAFYWKIPVVNKKEQSDKSYENDNLDTKETFKSFAW